MVSPTMKNECFATMSSSSPSASTSSAGSRNYFGFEKISVSRRCSQNPYRERRKYSDPVRLKESHSNFVRQWNGEIPVPRINPLCVLQARCNAATDFDSSRPTSGVFSSPRRMSRINQLLVDPELMKLRQRYERKIERRRSLSVANHSLAAEKANPAKSAVIDKYSRVLSHERRSLSETCLTKLNGNDIELSIFGIKHDKRVLFAAPSAKRRSMCPDQKPTPILHKEPKKIDEDYPLSHMDYATFRAWRTGEAFRLSVDSTPSEPEKPKPHEAAIRLVKYVIFSCLRR
uniref:Uncharacterized protein n=1 Tax=Panagrellus redivivus TaxID=6233 RepID=A0A7E4VC11_PANRE